MTTPRRSPVCVVVGVGPGNGEAFARCFAAAGHAVALLARRTELSAALAAELPDARAYACDVTTAASVESAFTRIQAEMGPVEVMIFNAGKGVWGDVESVSPADFQESWSINALGLFLTAQAVIPAMKANAGGNIVIVGATASRRGVAGTAAFAPAKAAQRALAESMARHLWPAGIHVSLIIVDGRVGGAKARGMFADKPADAFIDPNDIAKIALDLTRQARSAWSFEVEARPFNEKW